MWTRIWTFDTANFRVQLDVADEDMDPADSFEYQDDIDAVRNGDVAWFCARTRVTHKPTGAVLGEDHLGGCAYENIQRDFVESHWRAPYDRRNTLAAKARRVVFCDYFPEMVNNAVREARKSLASLKAA